MSAAVRAGCVRPETRRLGSRLAGPSFPSDKAGQPASQCLPRASYEGQGDTYRSNQSLPQDHAAARVNVSKCASRQHQKEKGKRGAPRLENHSSAFDFATPNLAISIIPPGLTVLAAGVGAGRPNALSRRAARVAPRHRSDDVGAVDLQVLQRLPETLGRLGSGRELNLQDYANAHVGQVALQ